MQVVGACYNGSNGLKTLQTTVCPGVFNATTTAAYSLDGQGLFNGQLLDDAQAAALVTGQGYLPPASTEASGSLTQTGAYYYQNASPSSYATELADWKSKQTDFPAVLANRVDGAIPIHNPTLAQIIEWAALKWGFHPKLGFGEGQVEDFQFIINAPGDVNSCADTGHDMWGGCSTGIEQVADRGANHGWSGLLTNNLAAESLAFQMDFFFMHYYAEYYGIFLEWGGLSIPTGGVNTGIVNDIQEWCQCSNYSTNVLNSIAAQGWFKQYYGGTTFPLAPATGTAIPQL